MAFLARTDHVRGRGFAAGVAVMACALALASCDRAGHGAREPSAARAALRDPRHAFWSTRSPDTFRVRFDTGKGSFVMQAHREWAPRGCDRFYNLVRVGLFDDSRFFRVRRGVFAQFGIPGDPAVAAIWRHEKFPDDPVRHGNTRGTVAYAMTGPGTRTTQLFINLRGNLEFDGEGFAPIGEIVQGIEVADRLYAEYGEGPGGGMRGGKQGPIFAGGNPYLDREFPLLDRLLRATIVGP